MILRVGEERELRAVKQRERVRESEGEREARTGVRHQQQRGTDRQTDRKIDREGTVTAAALALLSTTK